MDSIRVTVSHDETSVTADLDTDNWTPELIGDLGSRASETLVDTVARLFATMEALQESPEDERA